MPFEKYLLSQLNTTILPPKKRPYKIENRYRILENEIKKEEKAEAEAKASENKKKKGNKEADKK